MSEEVRVCTMCWEEDCICNYEYYKDFDEEIVDAIIELNKKGYRTIHCCGGHLNIDDEDFEQSRVVNAYVYFDRRYDFDLPYGFTWDRGQKSTVIRWSKLYKKKNNQIYVRMDYRYVKFDNLEEELKRVQEGLYEWAKSLPALEKNKYSGYTHYLLTGQPKEDYLEEYVKNKFQTI